MNVKKWQGTWPADCDLCGQPLQDLEKFYDARLYQGRWGLVCPTCFNAFGTGLGEGFGQEYDSKTLDKLRG